MTKLDVLKKCSFTSELSNEQLNTLAGMCVEETFGVGECLCKQGRPQEKMYVIEDGLVGIYLELGPMYKRQLQAASNCEVVGWAAMVPPYQSTATVMAIENTKVLAFNAKKLLDLCFTNPEMGCKLGRGLACVVALRLHSAYTQLMGVTSQD